MLNSIDVNCLNEIFSFLNLKSLLNFSITCKKYRQLFYKIGTLSPFIINGLKEFGINILKEMENKQIYCKIPTIDFFINNLSFSSKKFNWICSLKQFSSMLSKNMN